MNNTNTLAERAMLVSLRMSCWLPGRVDTRVSREVAAAHNVSNKRVVARKYVIDPDTPTYRAVRRALGDLRTRYYWHTLPWAHYGARILPAVSFAAYSDDVRKLSQRFVDAVETFTDEYPRLMTLALAEDTKGLIVASDFPANIRDCFGVDLSVMPIPTVGDFRVSMSDADAAALKAQMEAGVDAQVREALSLATREPYVRLYKHIARMVERLGSADALFQDSLVTGLRDLCALLPALNITGDAQLDSLREVAERMVAGVEPEALRNIPLLRERVCQDAKALKELIAPHVADNASTAPASDDVRREAAGIEATMGAMFTYMSGGVRQ
jgi:hypothetical protein